MRKIWDYNMKKGLFIGGAEIFISVIFYVTMKSYVGNISGIFSILTWLGLTLFFINKYRKQCEVLTFRQAFTLSFGMMLCAGLINTLYMYILTNFIEPDYIKLVIDNYKNLISSLYSKIDGTMEDIEDKLNYDENLRDYSLGKYLKGLVISSIFYAIFSLVLGLLFTKNTKQAK